jgi:DMSO/TMAO reductase YedYZ molybdopterin-dependent catalytic subunit
MTSRTTVLAGGLAGLLAGAAAVALSEATAAALDGVTSPLLAVANRAVDAAPRPVKEWAVATFGTADKAVLIGGVIATVALLAVAVGAVGVRRPRVALGAFVLLSLVATAAALTDRAATAGVLPRVVPAVVLLVVGLGSLAGLLRTVGGALGRLDQPGDLGRLDQPDRLDQPGAPVAFDRRAFLRAAAAVAVAAGAGGVAARALGGSAAAVARAELTIPRPAVPAPPLPGGAELKVAGVTPYLTSNRDFYRVDTALRVPDVELDSWSLRVHGLVDRELDLSFEDLLRRRLVEERITLTCVSNEVGGEYVGNATWIGVPLHELLAEAGVRPGADAVRSTSSDGFTAGTPLAVLQDERRNALVAVAMNGEPLPLEHGFPARMVTPGLYGYVSATKWLVDLEVTRFADFEAYWTTRGYSAQAPIKTSSRIDVPRSFARLAAGRHAVAGVAWSQDRGIAKVEVRVDGGDWQEAELAAEDNVNTWRQWLYRWDADPGGHKLEVRATDRSGYTQTSDRAPIAPDGATGWHSVDVIVE